MGHVYLKHLGKSKTYKNVYKYRQLTNSNKILYFGQIKIKGVTQAKYGFIEERECAKWVDIQLMRAGKQPRNIFKSK